MTGRPGDRRKTSERRARLSRTVQGTLRTPYMRKLKKIPFLILTVIALLFLILPCAENTQAASYTLVGASNSYIARDIADSAEWGTAAGGIRVYASEHGTYNTTKTGYNANLLIYDNKVLVAVFSECSTLPDAPKDYNSNSSEPPRTDYSAIINEGEYVLTYWGSNRKGTQGPFYKVSTLSGSYDIPCIRYNGSGSFVSSYANGIEVHAAAATKSSTAESAWSIGCVNIRTALYSGGYANMTKFANFVGTGTARMKIVRDVSAPDITLASSFSSGTVAQDSVITCTLTTSQAASGVTATLDGNTAKAMTAADSTLRTWTCTFTGFTRTGERTVVFSAAGRNGRAVTTSAKFTITAPEQEPIAIVSAQPSASSVSPGGAVTCTVRTNVRAASVSATLDGNAAKAMTSDASGTVWTCTYTNFAARLAERTVTFKATDASGKTATGTCTFTVTPQLTISLVSMSNSVKASGTQTLVITTNMPGASVSATLDGNAAKAMTPDAAKTRWTASWSSFSTAKTTRTITVTVRDQYGNTAAATYTFTVTK